MHRVSANLFFLFFLFNQFSTQLIHFITSIFNPIYSFFSLNFQPNLFILLFKFSVAGQDIINPIQSARIRTVNSFSFTYGTVEIRAKMPRGDWIWPGNRNLPTQTKYNPKIDLKNHSTTNFKQSSDEKN